MKYFLYNQRSFFWKGNGVLYRTDEILGDYKCLLGEWIKWPLSTLGQWRCEVRTGTGPGAPHRCYTTVGRCTSRPQSRSWMGRSYHPEGSLQAELSLWIWRWYVQQKTLNDDFMIKQTLKKRNEMSIYKLYVRNEMSIN